MRVSVSRQMKIVTFPRKNDYPPKRDVDFRLERETFRNKIMEIVEDVDEKNYNNNGKPWKSSRILRVNPIFSFFFVFSSFFRFFHFFIFFILSFFSLLWGTERSGVIVTNWQGGVVLRADHVLWPFWSRTILRAILKERVLRCTGCKPYWRGLGARVKLCASIPWFLARAGGLFGASWAHRLGRRVINSSRCRRRSWRSALTWSNLCDVPSWWTSVIWRA